MGTTLFAFSVLRDAYEEGPEPRFASTEAESGLEYVRSLDPAARFVVTSATVYLDGSDGNAYSDWETFVRMTADYGAESFLFKARLAQHREVVGEALGTSTGAPGETFALARKFVAHVDFGEGSSTLVVSVAGVAQALTTDYTVTLNGTAPTITTTASFDAGAVTADYHYYHQVRFSSVGAPRSLRRDGSLADEGAHVVDFSMREVVPGGSLA